MFFRGFCLSPVTSLCAQQLRLRGGIVAAMALLPLAFMIHVAASLHSCDGEC